MSAHAPKILHVCATDNKGGAALAARRLVAAQCAAGMNARLLVLRKFGDDDFTEQVASPLVYWRMRKARWMARAYCTHMAHDFPKVMRSLALLTTGLGREVARRKPDVVQWHWVGGETIGMGDLLATRHLPTIWTCRDHWIACGAEHFPLSGGNRDGYRARPMSDPDRWTFARKQRLLQQWKPQLVTLTHACIDALQLSPLTRDMPAEPIPNVVDFANLYPLGRAEARRKLGIFDDRPILLFGAQGGSTDPRKGFVFLEHALESLPQDMRDAIQLVTFGGSELRRTRIAGIDALELGPISPGEELRTAFSAASLFANPSLAEAFGNTNVEALACGTPCVAFATGNAIDLITGPEQGRLAEPGDGEGFARALRCQLETPDSDAARAARHELVASRFAQGRTIEAYRALYARMLGQGGVHG